MQTTIPDTVKCRIYDTKKVIDNVDCTIESVALCDKNILWHMTLHNVTLD